MFVSRKIVFGKPLSKLSCICLSLEKLVNGKHFPVNRKHFPVKEKFGLVSRKVFFLLALFVFQKVVSGKSFSKFSYVCLPLEKLVNKKYFSVKGKFGKKLIYEIIYFILIIIYFIWDNLWNYIFFLISFSFNFLICKICSLLF